MMAWAIFCFSSACTIANSGLGQSQQPGRGGKHQSIEPSPTSPCGVLWQDVGLEEEWLGLTQAFDHAYGGLNCCTTPCPQFTHLYSFVLVCLMGALHLQCSFKKNSEAPSWLSGTGCCDGLAMSAMDRPGARSASGICCVSNTAPSLLKQVDQRAEMAGRLGSSKHQSCVVTHTGLQGLSGQ